MNHNSRPKQRLKHSRVAYTALATAVVLNRCAASFCQLRLEALNRRMII
jgi:hypothetical protein